MITKIHLTICPGPEKCYTICMDISIEKDKTPTQIRRESRQIAAQFVDLTVRDGLSTSQAIATLGESSLDIQNEAVQREITRLLRKQNLSNEQLNALITAKITETMLTAERTSDQMKAADILAKKKEIGWNPPEKININIGFRTEQQALLDEIFDSMDNYSPKGEVIDVTPESTDD